MDTKIFLDEFQMPTQWYNVLPDLAAYDYYLSGRLEDYEHPEKAISAALKKLPPVKI